jgi:hypothetical protein
MCLGISNDRYVLLVLVFQTVACIRGPPSFFTIHCLESHGAVPFDSKVSHRSLLADVLVDKSDLFDHLVKGASSDMSICAYHVGDFTHFVTFLVFLVQLPQHFAIITRSLPENRQDCCSRPVRDKSTTLKLD